MFATRLLGHCATGKGSSYTKNEYNFFFVANLMVNIILLDNFFKKKKKKKVLSEKPWKTVLGAHLMIFTERKRLAPKIDITFLSLIRYWIFYYLAGFSKKKKLYFSRKWQKCSGMTSLFKRRGRLVTKMNITFFIGNEVSNIFSSNNFFEESNIFQKNSKKIWGGHDDFLGEGASYAKNEYNLFY